MMEITLAQSAPHLNRNNLKKICVTIKEHAADVIVFPELALNGYLLQD